jgi:hypothetical protein
MRCLIRQVELVLQFYAKIEGGCEWPDLGVRLVSSTHPDVRQEQHLGDVERTLHVIAVLPPLSSTVCFITPKPSCSKAPPTG